jgi:ABC-type Fe3+-siderophore transport system permease subunit
MLLDQATDTQMRAVGLAMGAAMAVFIGSRWMPRYGQPIRLIVAGLYLAALLGALVYFLF